MNSVRETFEVYSFPGIADTRGKIITIHGHTFYTVDNRIVAFSVGYTHPFVMARKRPIVETYHYNFIAHEDPTTVDAKTFAALLHWALWSCTHALQTATCDDSARDKEAMDIMCAWYVARLKTSFDWDEVEEHVQASALRSYTFWRGVTLNPAHDAEESSYMRRNAQGYICAIAGVYYLGNPLCALPLQAEAMETSAPGSNLWNRLHQQALINALVQLCSENGFEVTHPENDYESIVLKRFYSISELEKMAPAGGEK